MGSQAHTPFVAASPRQVAPRGPWSRFGALFVWLLAWVLLASLALACGDDVGGSHAEAAHDGEGDLAHGVTVVAEAFGAGEPTPTRQGKTWPVRRRFLNLDLM